MKGDSMVGCKHATPQTSLARRMVAVLAAFALCVGLVPAASTTAWAADDDAATITVALTVVDTTDDDSGVLCNKAVEMDVGTTVADLLSAAGFTEAATAEETASDDSLYFNSWGSPTFRGNNAVENGDGSWTYWVTMFGGDSANYASASLAAELVDGGYYQYIYTNATTFGYDDAIADPLAVADDDTGDSDDGGDAGEDADTGDDADESDAVGACLYDAAEVATLIENLTARFSAGGADASITNATMYAALAVNAQGLGSKIDADAILENLEDFEETNGYAITAGTLAKYIMALTAAGMDCTAVETKDGTRDLVAEMESLVTSDLDVYSAVFVLAVYDYGSYEQGSCELGIDGLIDVVLASADDAGLFGNVSYGCDVETTAQAILALLPYGEDADVAAAIETATAAILALQNEDGGFGYSATYTDSDVDVTAYAVAALAALGYDCAAGTELTTANGSTPSGYLLAMADETLDGYADCGSWDEAMTAATALLGLVAAQGYVDAGAAFNVYKLQAASETTSEAESTETGTETEEAAESTDDTDAGASTLAQTGDEAAYAAAAVAATALLCAAATAFAMARRLRRQRL